MFCIDEGETSIISTGGPISLSPAALFYNLQLMLSLKKEEIAKHKKIQAHWPGQKNRIQSRKSAVRGSVSKLNQDTSPP